MKPNLHLLFTLGSLEVYFDDGLPYAAKPPQKDIYWRDKKDPQGYGPFDSLWSAMRHYENIVAVRTPHLLTDVSKLIKVDFKSKKRL